MKKSKTYFEKHPNLKTVLVLFELVIIFTILLFLTSFIPTKSNEPVQETITYSNFFENPANWRVTPFETLDQETFELLSDNFAKDAQHVYFYSHGNRETNFEDFVMLLPNTDPKTFKLSGEKIAKDSNNLYIYDYEINLIDGADPQTFEILDGSFAKDKNFIYNIYESPIKLEMDVDISTFEILNYYAKDKDHVFVYVGYVGGTWEPLEGVDPNTFTELTDAYAKDKNHVFGHCFQQEGSCNVEIKEADPNTFEALGSNFAKDKNNVYYFAKSVPKTDSETFNILPEENGSYQRFAKDKYAIYAFAENSIYRFDEIDSETVEILYDPYTYNSWTVKDKNNTYNLKRVVTSNPSGGYELSLTEIASPSEQ